MTNNNSGTLANLQEAEVTFTEPELWVIKHATPETLEYARIDWYSGDEADIEAQNDGCSPELHACTPNGFYWRYHDGPNDTTRLALTDSSGIIVRLICNTAACTPDTDDDQYQTMTFANYLAIDSQCHQTPTACNYYGLGTAMNFFQMTPSNGSINELMQWYVP